MKKAIFPILAALMLLVLPAAAQDAQTPAELCAANTPAEEPENRQFEAAEQVLEEGIDYRAIFCTSEGAIYVDLFEEETPLTVNNFVFLAQQGFYNNSNFHRVLPGFMVQGGDPVGVPSGTGGPGYQFEDEFVGELTFAEPGKLAMANAGPGTNGSQFFITTAPTEHLNNAHTIFGEVVNGMALVEKLQLRDPSFVAQDAPASTLDAVLIVTDPATVTEGELEVVPATQEDFERILTSFPIQAGTVLEQFGQGLSTIITYDDAGMGVMTPESLAEGTEGAMADHYVAFPPEFVARANFNLADCATNLSAFPIENGNVEYAVYPTAEEASAALAALPEVLTSYGLQSLETTLEDYLVFITSQQTCDGGEGTVATGVRQVGRYIMITNTLYTAAAFDATPEEMADVIVGELSDLVFTIPFRAVLAPEQEVQ